MVLVVANVCFKEMDVESFAPTATAEAIDTPSRARVKVCEEPDVFATKISVTTAVVEDGTVYRVVVVVVVAAPRKSAFEVTGIGRCPFKSGYRRV